MKAATRLGSMSFLNSSSTPWIASSTLMPCSSLGKGAWKISLGKGPTPSLYGSILPVRPSASRVRPWKPPLKAITPGRPVKARAILIEFSTASAPVLISIVFFAPSPGASAFRRSHRLT